MEFAAIMPATKAALQAVKTDVQALKVDVQDLKVTTQELKEDLKAVRTDIQRLDEVTRHIAKEQIKMRDEMATKQDMKIIQAQLRENTQTLDFFSKRLETYGRESVIFPKTLDAHSAKLRDHERRISAVESARA